MQESRMAFLERLMETICPSGYEEEASFVWRADAEQFADRVWNDQHGNSYALFNEGGSPRVMLAGHIDEIGLLITRIDEEGFLSFSGIGIWDPQILPGQRVRIRGNGECLIGIIGRKPIHQMKNDAFKQGVEMDDLWIDIGVAGREDAERVVAVGDVAVLDYGFAQLQNGFVTGRGLDDRIGAFVALEAARLADARGLKSELVAVATVQEEIGYRGAITSTFSLDPDAAIAIDVWHATDVPSTNTARQRNADVHLGSGPVITRGPYTHHALAQLLVDTATSCDIPHQLDACTDETGTDMDVLQLSRNGVATALIGIPNRYMHSPCEMIHIADLSYAAQLISETILSLSLDFAFK